MRTHISTHSLTFLSDFAKTPDMGTQSPTSVPIHAQMYPFIHMNTHISTHSLTCVPNHPCQFAFTDISTSSSQQQLTHLYPQRTITDFIRFPPKSAEQETTADLRLKSAIVSCSAGGGTTHLYPQRTITDFIRFPPKSIWEGTCHDLRRNRRRNRRQRLIYA